MKSPGHEWGFKPQERFRLQFQQRLTDHQLRQGSVAEGFGIVWEKTLEQVPVDDTAQGKLYRELITWARSNKLFTGGRPSQLRQPSRQTVHEF